MEVRADVVVQFAGRGGDVSGGEVLFHDGHHSLLRLRRVDFSVLRNLGDVIGSVDPRNFMKKWVPLRWRPLDQENEDWSSFRRLFVTYFFYETWEQEKRKEDERLRSRVSSNTIEREREREREL